MAGLVGELLRKVGKGVEEGWGGLRAVGERWERIGGVKSVRECLRALGIGYWRG